MMTLTCPETSTAVEQAWRDMLSAQARLRPDSSAYAHICAAQERMGAWVAYGPRCGTDALESVRGELVYALGTTAAGSPHKRVAIRHLARALTTVVEIQEGSRP